MSTCSICGRSIFDSGICRTCGLPVSLDYKNFPPVITVTPDIRAKYKKYYNNYMEASRLAADTVPGQEPINGRGPANGPGFMSESGPAEGFPSAPGASGPESRDTEFLDFYEEHDDYAKKGEPDYRFAQPDSSFRKGHPAKPKKQLHDLNKGRTVDSEFIDFYEDKSFRANNPDNKAKAHQEPGPKTKTRSIDREFIDFYEDASFRANNPDPKKKPVSDSAQKTIHRSSSFTNSEQSSDHENFDYYEEDDSSAW